MAIWLLLLLDGAFYAFHSGLILLNVFGWMNRRTRRLNLIALLLTGASWTLMGLHYGLGYCVCTDIHWRIRAALGIHDRAETYIQLLVYNLTGWMPSVGLASTVTAIVFVFSMVASVIVNTGDFRRHVAAKRQDTDLQRAR